MRTCLLLILVGVGLGAGGLGAQAQPGTEVAVTADATPAEAGTEEAVTFTVRVRGASPDRVTVPSPPSTENLVLQDPVPSTQREVSFDEGRLTRRTTFSWTFEPVRVGMARLHPITVRVRGEDYTTEEIRVRVVPQSQRSSRAPRSQPTPGASASTSEGAGAGRMGPRDLFIRTQVSTQEAYQNEQVAVEYRLFFRPGIRLRQSRMAEAWDAPGFWREELNVASRPTPQATEAYGRTYETIVLKRVALFPTRTGTLRVDPLRIETEAQAGRSGRGESIPRTRYEPVTLASDTVTVDVASLPPDPPRAFDGAVGQFALETEVDRDSVEVGEALTLTARIRGTGNLTTLSPPSLEPPSDFELYDPTVDSEVDRSGERVRGTKTFTYTLVPRSNGTYTLPPVAFSYFDPEADRYETHRSDPVTLHVTGDVGPRAMGQTGQGLPVGDIAGPMDEATNWVRTDRPPLYRQPWVYLVLMVPVALAAGGALYRQYGAGMAGAPAASTDASADEVAKAEESLRTARRHLEDGEKRSFYAAVERAMWTILEARLPALPASGRREALNEALVRHDVPEADRTALRELLDTCDRAQYTPASPSRDVQRAALDHAETLLHRLDETLPRAPDA